MSPETYHPALERTSPKEMPFVGYCRVCGKTGLTFADMNEEGRKPCKPDIDRDQLMLDAVEGAP